MKKLMLVLTVVFFLLGLTACGGGGKYGEVTDVMNQFIDAQEKFAAAAEKASSADDAVAAINDFAAAMEKIGPKMAEMPKKYPELKEKDNPPEEIKPLMEKIEAAGKKMMADIMDKGLANMKSVVEGASKT